MTLPIFILQPDHAAWCLDGAVLTADDAGGLTFEFHAAGWARVVLKSTAPLRIVNQAGLETRLQPGWDGTLGYSFYILEVSAQALGTGRVQLSTEPEPVPLTASVFGVDTGWFGHSVVIVNHRLIPTDLSCLILEGTAANWQYPTSKKGLMPHSAVYLTKSMYRATSNRWLNQKGDLHDVL